MATMNSRIGRLKDREKKMTAGYIIGQIGGPIYGYGATEDEAMAVARKWASNLSEVRPFVPGRMVAWEMFISPASGALIERVKEVGGDIRYVMVDGIAILPEEEEDLLI